MSAERSDALTWKKLLRLGWGEKLLICLMTALPLAAMGVIAALFVRFFGPLIPLPGWGVWVIAVPIAVMAVMLFIGSMGNDMMDVLVGSVILLVLVSMLAPVFHRARAAQQKVPAREAARMQRQAPAVPRQAEPLPR